MRWLLLLLSLSGCLAAPPVGHGGPPAPCKFAWPHEEVPIRLQLESGLPPSAYRDVLVAVDYLELVAGADLFEPTIRRDDVADATGTIVLEREPLVSDTLVGQAVYMYRNHRVLWARIQIAAETWQRDTAAMTVAHELGHALGLPHSPWLGSLMFPSTDQGGWLLSDEEAACIRAQAGEAP